VGRRPVTGTKTAAELTTLAWEAVAWRDERAQSYRDGWHLYVYRPGDFEVAKEERGYGPSTAKNPLLHAPLSIVDREPLARALLASAVTTSPEWPSTAPGYRAWIGNALHGGATAHGESEIAARAALLDALLAVPEARD
jgi:hypothetical protein